MKNICHEPGFSSSLFVLLTVSFVLSDKVSLETAKQSSVSACLLSPVATVWLFLITECPSVPVQMSVGMVSAGSSVADTVNTNTHV